MNDERFEAAAARIEAAHREDPRTVEVDGVTIPWAVHYHRHMANWQHALAPDAGEALRLACRAQHIRRWALPREDFPEGLRGYKRWRSTLAMRHADDAAEILRAVGYDEETVKRVGELLRKKGLRSDSEVQVLEDAACLTFLEIQFADFAAKHPDEKVIDIVQKTWRKMSPAGHEAALGLLPAMDERAAALVKTAVA